MGEEFLSRYGGTVDPVTSVEPERSRTGSCSYSPCRVREFRAYSSLLSCCCVNSERSDQEEKIAMGKLMYESHASYSACGLGSTGTDLLVDLVKSAGVGSGTLWREDHRRWRAGGWRLGRGTGKDAE